MNPLSYIVVMLVSVAPLVSAQHTTYTFKNADQLPSIRNLPDPFLMSSGLRVETTEDWNGQRNYLKAMLQEYMYGQLPEGPFHVSGRELSSVSALDGKAIKKIVEISCGPVIGNEIKFNCTLFVPRNNKPCPVVMRNSVIDEDYVEMGINRGYIMMWFNRNDLDHDIPYDPSPYSLGQVQSAYPDLEFPTLMVWAWGHMRIVDWLEQVDYADAEKIVVTGLSRGGKSALLAAAYDERIAIAAPCGSAFAGCASMKYIPEELVESKGVFNWMKPAEGHEAGKREYWFCLRLKEFIDKEDKLPFDQHFLMALVAPRGLISLDGLADTDSSPWGTHQSSYGAQVVYDWLGAGKNMAMHFHTQGHVQNRESYEALLQFADWYFFKKEPVLDLYKRHFFAEEKLMDWNMPVKRSVSEGSMIR